MTDSALHDQAARAALGSGSGAQQGSVTTVPGASGQPAPGGTGIAPASPGAGALPGAGASAVPGAKPGTGTVGAPPGAGGNGGATAIGVTANSITVGTVATLSGPVPGLFQGAIAGVKAYFAYVNSQGGLYGRTLKVDGKDDAFDCSTNKRVTQDAINRDFAVVGSFSIYDYCGAQAVKASPGAADVSMAISPDHTALKNNFAVQPVVAGFRTGALQYYKSKFGNAYQTSAALYVSSPSAVSAYHGLKATMLHLGYSVVYERSVGPTDSSFTSDVIQMKSKNVKFVEILANPPIIANFMAAAVQQDFHPIVTTPGQGYDEATLSQGGSNVEGLYTDTPSALYFNKDEAKRIPAVALFQKWMAQAAPGISLDLFSVYGWAQADLFVRAATKAGPKLTRPAIMTALQGISSFSDDILAPGYPSTKGPATCYVLTKVVKGAFVRVDTPPTSYRCDGPFFHSG
jgi:ABC-type branched-subunit amino acid transport system substrate-binding protein